MEEARAPFDFTPQFKANFTYELPIGKGHNLFGSPNRLLGLLVNGWQTGSIFTWQSGTPLSIISGQPTFNRSGTRSAHNTAVATLTHQQIINDPGTFVQANGIVYLINPKLIASNGTGAPASAGVTCTPAVPAVSAIRNRAKLGTCNSMPSTRQRILSGI